jgi:tRNA A37 N6-isopentenylltransferase MiaA
MSNIFSKERPNEINPNSDYNKNKIISDEIKQIINKIFNNNEKISNNDKEIVNKLLLLKKTRRQLLKEINNYCLNNINSSLLNEISFDNTYNLLKEALKILQIEKDYESVKLILNFATTFYQICGQKEKKKLFIQNKLVDEKIFQSYDFWKELTKYTIIEEMFNQKSFNLFYNNKENKEKNKLRIKEIVISKINIYLNYMIDFKCNQNFMKKLIQEFKEYYELSDDDTQKFKNKLNEYKKKIENIGGNEQIREDVNANVNDDNLGNLNINEINESPNNEEEKKSNSTEENSQL